MTAAHPASSPPGSVTGGRLTVEAGVPDAARRLIWNIFFMRAGRGIDFAAHLPWAADPDVRTVVLHEGHDVLAAAVVRPARQAGVAMVGFVCVDEAWRGRGYGRDLMAAVNAAVDEAGFRAALLWTGKPAIYVGTGYQEVGRDSVLRVSRLPNAPPAPATVTQTPWPGSGDRAGLPAFATAARRFRSDRAEAVVAQGARGTTLINWRGDPADVVALVDGAGHTSWMVNTAAPDAFSAALPANRFAVSVEDGAAAMARRRGAGFPLDHVPVAERI